MARRKWIACFFLLALFALGGTYGILWLTRLTPGLTEENARLLRCGMTLSDVEELFCSPGTPYATTPSIRYYWTNECTPLVVVDFDDALRLKSAMASRSIAHGGVYFQRVNVNESFIEWFRRMLRL